jgi:lipid-A-disaccharide synthase-like uncharacterized protein
MNNPGVFLQPFLGSVVPWLYYESPFWTIFGLTGNFLFSLRFVVQWLHSEKKKELVVPDIFWHFSLWGSVITLIYAFHVDKLPVILGYFFLPILYARSLLLLSRGKRRKLGTKKA